MIHYDSMRLSHSQYMGASGHAIFVLIELSLGFTLTTAAQYQHGIFFSDLYLIICIGNKNQQQFLNEL